MSRGLIAHEDTKVEEGTTTEAEVMEVDMMHVISNIIDICNSQLQSRNTLYAFALSLSADSKCPVLI